MKGDSGNSPNISWRNIGIIVSPIFMNGSGCKTMIGPMNNEIKQRKLTVCAKRSRSIGSARPEELRKTADVVTDTDRNLHAMFEILKKARKVKVEILLLNIYSFAQTVENLFALSFLVKDGRVRLDVDESGSEIVVPSNGPSAEEIKSGVTKSHQFIFRLDFSDWELMKNLVSEGEELMPHRNPFSDATCTQAKAEPAGNDISQSAAVQNYSQQAAAVKKLSRNYGRFVQNSDLTKVGDGAVLNWNSKRKRSVL
ncbi:hypothetical protein BUALT_Bualt13G0040400 [Buddleja alternifolia]|uniref:Non-structural maintenance of chromosomes element 4 n=1 Tax=Buddleja alternifolia TaxID=168488 RepID=A0AAV6WVI2_9LAMI|nr:hypothetical protein BUALT_Bualt13G0040400 [Buddleja alternifolia]